MIETLDPKDVTLMFNGILLTGFAEEKITIEFDAPITADAVGSDGDVVSMIQNDKRANITVRLLQASPSNLDLSDAANLHGLDGATAVYPLLIKDNRSGDLFSAEAAWVQTRPRVGYSKNQETREWVLRAAALNYTISGVQQTA